MFLKNYITWNSQGKKKIILFWIPSHVGILGNEKADYAAKEALNVRPSSESVCFSDFKCSVRALIRQQWQSDWDKEIRNKLHGITTSLSTGHNGKIYNRRDEIVLSRLRIGHTHITHTYLLNQLTPPICNMCHDLLTVKHFLVQCPAQNNVRSTFFTVNSLQQLFQDIDYSRILDYLRAIGYYDKI